MKKLLPVLFLLLPAALLFAANGQKVIPLESGVYEALDALYALEGKALASTTRPWTVAETRKHLSKVSSDTAPELHAIVFEAVSEEPQITVDDYFGMTFSFHASLTGYAHTDKAFVNPFDGFANYLFRTKNDNPTIQMNWEAWAGEHLYTFAWYKYRNSRDKDRFSSYHFNFDIANLTPAGLTTDIDQREPSRAFIVAGGESWSLLFGRNSLQIGTGNSGSLILDNTFPYHNVLQFSLFGQKYKYSFVMSFLPHMKNDAEGLLYYMTHRFECRFLSDRLYAAVNESIMYKNDSGFFDIRYVNPVMFFHNYFIPFLANSIVDLEVVFAPAGGWNLYGQLVIDQFTSPMEMRDNDGAEPLALGAMAGAKYTRLLGNGVFSIGLEAVYTMPYLYLRATHIPEESSVQDPEDPGLGYIGPYRWSKYFLGYRYGGDAVAADLKTTYEVPGDCSISAEVLFMVHGEKNIGSLFRTDDNAFAPSGNACVFSFAELTGKKRITERISVYGQYDFVISAGKSDNQFVLGIEADF